MSWAAVIDNPKHLEAYFDSFEGLEAVSLFEVGLDREGSHLLLRADLLRFPDRRSPRWHLSVNQAQARISLWDVSELEIKGWATTIEGKLVMERDGSTQVSFAFHSSSVNIKGRCGVARLDDLTAYVTQASRLTSR